jgi:ATP-dependent protease HslVU (ClpYQ) peptidase subunit
MTTIVGLQEHDRCTIGADAQTSSGDRFYASPRQPKVVDLFGALVACAGSGYACDVAMHRWRPPASTGIDTYKHMVTKVVPSLRAAFAEHDVTFKDDESFQALIAIEGEIFHIESDFTVLLRDDGMYAIGSGAAYAIGALHMGASIAEAIEIAAANDIYTSLPATVITQRR